MKDKNSIHYFELNDIMTQFCSAFDSIIINRYEKKVQKGQARVRFVYAPKQRVLHNLINKAEHITVPVIAVSLGGITRDKERVHNKNSGHFINNGSDKSFHIPQPIPVNITVNMTIVTRYQTDMDQILGNFIPYTDPYIIISWKYPSDFTTIPTELRSEVLWDENINLNQPTEMGEGDKYRNVADTTFTIKGWLFKKHPDTPVGNIYEVDASFYPISSFVDIDDQELSSDTFSLSAYPDIDEKDGVVFIADTENTYKLTGLNFEYTENMYLSSDVPDMFDEPLVSYGDFSGIELNSDRYDVISSDMIYLTTPILKNSGNLTIIVENPSGFGVSSSITVKQV